MNFSHFRPKRKSFAKCGDGFVGQTPVAQRDTQIVMGLRIIRLEPDGVAVDGNGLARQPFVAQDVTEIVVILRTVGIDCDRSLDQFNAGIQSTALVGDDTQQMQRLGMIRPLG